MSRAQNNNNPGNLRPGAGKILWDGQTGTDPDGFAVFSDKEHGLAAARKQVLLDYNQHGLKTPAQLASKYTKTDQGSYAQHLAQALGIGVNDDANLNDPAHFATYMGQLYGNEDAQAATPTDPGAEFGNAADLSAPQSSSDFESAANLAPAPPSSAPDHFEAATGEPASPPPQAAATADPFAAALNAPEPGQPTLKDTTTAAVNDILAHKGGAAELRAYFDAQNLKVDPKDIDGAVAAHNEGKTYTIPFDLPPALSVGVEAEAGADRGARDIAGTIGDIAAWADRKIPGALALDNALGGMTGVQGNALTQKANADTIRDSYDQGPYSNSLISGATRLGTNIALSAPLVAGGEGLIAPLAADALPAGTFEFAAGRGGTNLLTRGASFATRGATAGAEFGAANSGGNDQSLGQNMLTGSGTGAVLAPAVGTLGAGASRLFSGKADPFTANLAQQALDAGIPVRGSQISGNPLVRSADTLLGKVPGSGMSASNEAQRQEFTRAISHTFGEDAPALTPEVMANAKQNIGARIGKLADGVTISDTEPLVNDLAEIEDNAKGVLENPAPVHQQISNILAKIGPDGQLAGSDYKALIRKGGPLDTLAGSSDPSKRKLAGDIRDALDDAFQSSADTETAAKFRAARLQYKNLMTVKQLAAKSPDGSISPALLQNAVTNSFKDRAFSGAGDLGTLGDIGQRFLKPAPSSNTAENNLLLQGALTLGKYTATAGAGALGIHAGLPPIEAVGGALGSAAATAALARGASRFMASPAYATRVIRSAVDDGAVPVNPLLAKIGVPVGAVEANRLRAVGGARR